MLKLFNHNCEYIKIETDILQDIISNPSNYQKLIIEGSINECNISFLKEYNFDLPQISGNCSNDVNTYVLDLKGILDNQLSIEELNVKNILTGQVFNILNSNFTFNNTCYTSNNDVIDTCPDVTTLDGLIDTWFTNNTYWSNIKTNVVNNKLYICNLPLNFVIQDVKCTDGTLIENYLFHLYNNEDMFINNFNLYLLPSFFEQTEIIDGIYKIKIKIIKNDGSYIEQENCSFIDCKTKCNVAKKITEALQNKDTFTNIHMIHYALINASNCGCNCSELFDLYKYLISQIDNTKQNECSTCQ